MSFIHRKTFKGMAVISATSTSLNAPKSTIFKKKVKYGLILNSKKARLSTTLVTFAHELSMGCKGFGVIIFKDLAT